MMATTLIVLPAPLTKSVSPMTSSLHEDHAGLSLFLEDIRKTLETDLILFRERSYRQVFFSRLIFTAKMFNTMLYNMHHDEDLDSVLSGPLRPPVMLYIGAL